MLSYTFSVYQLVCSLIYSLLSDSCFQLFGSDGETFISADDLRINLWDLEIINQSFNIVDVKPVNMEDLTGLFSPCIIHVEGLQKEILNFN